ncbi:hypothetical protein M3Y94_00725500 [Aphelenchoides besseyi]|nr:hypothetical protein M3Y94_00725500 [Aphelenchoides besseyi]KAI6231837.1 hypothetical protein M3Y95_00423300 [Aphelenchoides besseyi]
MESNRTVGENTRLDLSDCSLWRTKVNSTHCVEDDELTVETNLAVTDCSLWRTRVRESDAFADTNSRPSDVQSINRTRFEITDNSLWRTRVRESNASEENDSGVSADSQPIVEAQQQPISPIIQKPRFEETDNSELVDVLSALKDKRSLSQTVEKNEARRKTINPLTPRRRANSSKLPNAPRVPVFAPFFNRLSTSGSEASSRPSVGSNSSIISASSTSGPSTPEHSRSTFNATEPPRPGPISSQPLRLASKQRTLQWHEDEAGSIFDPVPNPEPIESQQIASQVPLKRPPFRLLNDDDFTIGSPVQAPTSKHKSPVAEVARCVPNDSHFNENSIVAIDLDETIHEETSGQSFVDGGSDSDSDVASPAPKHIILRKPVKKAEKYLRALKPKILIGADEIRAQHPELRRSTRTRLSRPCNRALGERPIYACDSQGNFCLVGVQEGRTADPLCKKWGTFDKEKAIEMDKAAGKRPRVAKEVNREKWQRDFHNH